ncbi:MAG: AmmeMemoRadiSam system protein A, partial [Blastocatellia bacterium]
VPEVGGDRIAEVAESQRALRSFSQQLIRSKPDTVVLISPHSPLDSGSFLARSTAELSGDFGEFRASKVRLRFPNDLELLKSIEAAAADVELHVKEIRGEYPLDHGAMVPLYYLVEAGWTGPVVVLSFTMLSNEKHLAFGGVLKEASARANRKIALVASGDLSHRLIVGGPYEYEPTAHEFDEQVVQAIAEGQPSGVLNIDPGLRERAGECGYRSIVIALGAVGDEMKDSRVLSYEGPFGVGYMVAVLKPCQDPVVPFARFTRSQEILKMDPPPTDISPQALARMAVEEYIGNGIRIPGPLEPEGLLAERAGAFVTLRHIQGDLRGCIGTVSATCDNLAEEIIQNAISAATRDPRFREVRASELSELVYGVDVLSEPEDISGLKDLDSSLYGVIIEANDESRRGLLLPRIEGIDTAEQQWEAVHHKAGIKLGSPVRVQRFQVRRFGKD